MRGGRELLYDWGALSGSTFTPVIRPSGPPRISDPLRGIEPEVRASEPISCFSGIVLDADALPMG